MKYASLNKKGFERKYILGLESFMIFIVLLIATLFSLSYRKAYMDASEEQCFSLTRSVADEIDGDKVTEYLETLKADDEYYRILKYMRDLQKEFDIKYFYVIAPRINNILYVWETHYDPATDPIIGFETPYADMNVGKELVNSAFNKNPEEKLFSYDDEQFGKLITAATPVLNSKGVPVALVCVDMSRSAVETTIFTVVIRFSAMLIILMLISIIGYFFVMRKNIIIPLLKLHKAASEIVDNLESGKKYVSDIHTGDEIEALSDAFEKMDNGIRTYIQKNAEIAAEKERIGAELDMAKSIQASQLPSIFPAFPERNEFDVYASMTPAKEVGGDFYDFFMADDDHIVLVMADVSGKGVPAALFMMISKILIKNHMQNGESPGATLSSVNDQLLEGNKEGFFVTVWMAVIQISTGKGVAVNAGHEHPVLKRADGEYELVKYRHSPAVSTMEGIPFREHEFELYPGDSIFVYTDGVAEATNKEEELFGTDRLLEALNSEPDAEPEKVLENVMNGINEFVKDAEQFDDITMLSFKYLGTNPK